MPAAAQDPMGFEASVARPGNEGIYNHAGDQDVKFRNPGHDTMDNTLEPKRQYPPPSELINGRTGVADEVPQQGEFLFGFRVLNTTTRPRGGGAGC